MNEIILGKEALSKIVKGVEKVTEAVKVTMGKYGSNVIVEKQTNPLITKDGVSVAFNITLEDNVENIGASLVKQVAMRTNELVGDGTTTTIVLFQSILSKANSFIQNGYDQNKLSDEIKKAGEIVLNEIKENKTDFDDSNIKLIATTSAKDEYIGELLDKAFKEVGKNGVVNIEVTDKQFTEVKVDSGFRVNGTYMSPTMINDKVNGVVDMKDANILVIDSLTKQESITSIAESFSECVIFTNKVSEDIRGYIDSLNVSGKKIVVVINRYSKLMQDDLMEDISCFVGVKFITEDNLSNIDHEYHKKADVYINKEGSVLKSNIDVSDRINLLKRLLEDVNIPTKDIIKERISNLQSKVATIYIGGASRSEINETKDRVEDAINAVISSYDGVVNGGGKVLIESRNKLLDVGIYSTGSSILYDSLGEPSNIIGYGDNVLDSYKVTVTALSNAINMACTVITTKAVVISKELNK